MNLWTWAGETYLRPGAEAEFMALQDDHGQCVPFLLWAAWSGETDPERLKQAAQAAAAWNSDALEPLRRVRRALKPHSDLVGDAPREALRARVKAAELESEQVLIETLEKHFPKTGAPPEAALKAAAVLWNPKTPGPMIDQLVLTLGL